jgi:mannitol-specific phosphotransferase system IIBC component
MNSDNHITETKAGMTGGMVLTLLSTVNSGDVIKTIVLAAVGAVVSFGVSMLLKMLAARMKKRKG